MTTAERAEVTAAYEGGESSNGLAARFHVSKTSILSTLKDAGVQLRYRPMTEADIVHAAALYGSGKPLSQLAEELPFSQEAIRRALQKIGVALRPAITRVGHFPS